MDYTPIEPKKEEIEIPEKEDGISDNSSLDREPKKKKNKKKGKGKKEKKVEEKEESEGD